VDSVRMDKEALARFQHMYQSMGGLRYMSWRTNWSPGALKSAERTSRIGLRRHVHIFHRKRLVLTLQS
jgi:hypothetical protein